MNLRVGTFFYRDVHGGWRWEHFDYAGEASDSQHSFDTKQACMDDARVALRSQGGAPSRRPSLQPQTVERGSPHPSQRSVGRTSREERRT